MPSNGACSYGSDSDAVMLDSYSIHDNVDQEVSDGLTALVPVLVLQQ